MSFNVIFTFRVNCRNSLWNLVVIFNFRGGSTFNFRPILNSFPTELKNLQRTKTILRERVPFYQEKEAIFEVILSTCSEFSQIGTPHFSLEGVVSVDDKYDDKFDDENRIDANKAELFSREIFCRVVSHPVF